MFPPADSRGDIHHPLLFLLTSVGGKIDAHKGLGYDSECCWELVALGFLKFQGIILNHYLFAIEQHLASLYRSNTV